MHRFRTSLWALLIASAFSSASATEVSFEDRVRNYILAHPEVIIEALTILSEREERAAIKARIAEHAGMFEEPPYHGIGPGDAPLRVIEFFDYKCAPCKALHEPLVQALAADPGIRVEMRHLPILSPSSESAARFALAVRRLADPGTYQRVHDALWSQKGPLGTALFAQLATGAHLDWQAVEAAMYSDWVTARIDANRDTAIALEILGTPAFVSKSSVSVGSTDVDALIALWRAP